MVECFLVVALSMNGLVVSRNFNSYREIPEERISLVMAMEAGRNGAQNTALLKQSSQVEYFYGYDCGHGWVNKGVSKEEVF